MFPCLIGHDFPALGDVLAVASSITTSGNRVAVISDSVSSLRSLLDSARFHDYLLPHLGCCHSAFPSEHLWHLTKISWLVLQVLISFHHTSRSHSEKMVDIGLLLIGELVPKDQMGKRS